MSQASRFRVLAAAIAGAIVLSGCQKASRIDASSTPALQASLDKVAATVIPPDRAKWDQARKRFEQVYLSPGDTTPSTTVPDIAAIDGMTASQFFDFVQITLATTRENPDEPLFPSATLATRLKEQLELEEVLLTQARDAVLDRGKNTVDQYPIVDVAFIPPGEHLPVDLDKARFVLTMRNDSGFDAYRPEFRVEIRRPNDPIAVLERDFKFDQLKEPIAPGRTARFDLECCGALTDPYHNTLIKQLPQDAQIEISLIDIKDHTNATILAADGFTMEDHERLLLVQHCIKRLSGDLATWTPDPGAGDEQCLGAPRSETLLGAR